MTGRRGLLTWSVYATIIAVSLVQGALGALLPLIGAEMPMSHTVESFHVTGLAAGGLLSALVVERVRRRVGRWRVILGAVGVGVVAALLISGATSPLMTVTGSLLVGVGVSGVLIAGQTLLVARHPGRGAKVIGEANVSFSVGAVLATTLLPLVVVWWGWRSFPLLQVGLLLLLAAPLLLVSRAEALAVPERHLHDPTRPVRAARHPSAVYVAMCAAVMVEWAFLFWLPTYFTQVSGLGEVLAARLTAMMFIAIMLVRLVGAGVMNRVGPAPVMVTSTLLTMGGLGLLLVTTTPLMAAAVAVVIGLAVGNIYPAGMALVVAAHPTRTDHAVARASLLVSVSVIVFPLILGSLADAVGMRAAFLIVPVIAAAAVLAVRHTGVSPQRPALPPGVRD